MAKANEAITSQIDSNEIYRVISNIHNEDSVGSSKIDYVIKQFEQALGANFATALNQNAFAEELQKQIKSNEDALTKLAIANQGEFTADDLQPYIDQAHKKLAATYKKNIETYSAGAGLETAKKFFIRTIDNGSDLQPLKRLETLERDDKDLRESIATATKNKDTDYAETLSGRLPYVKYAIYENKIKNKPGTFSKSATKQSYLDEIQNIALRFLRDSNALTQMVTNNANAVIGAAIAEYGSTGAVANTLEALIANTVESDVPNAFQTNMNAYYTALNSDAVQNHIKSQPAKIGHALFTQKMTNGSSFAINALALAKTYTGAIDLQKEPFVVASLLSATLGEEYTTELLNAAISYNTRAYGKLHYDDYKDTAERFSDYLLIMKEDPAFKLSDEKNTPAQALINYNQAITGFEALEARSVDDIQAYLKSDVLGSVISPIKEALFAKPYAGHTNFLGFLMEHRKESKQTAKNPSSINEAFAIEQLVQATSPKFVKELTQAVIKKSSDSLLRSRLDNILPLFDRYEDSTVYNYAQSAYVLSESVERKVPEKILWALDQAFLINTDSESRLKVFTRKTALNSPDSTPLFALYNHVKSDNVTLASTLAKISTICTSGKEKSAYYSELRALAKKDGEPALALLNIYISVLKDHDEKTLLDLARTQKTLQSSFDAQNKEALNALLASPELNDLPQDVQGLAIDNKTTSQLLMGLLQSSGNDAVAQAQSFAQINALIKNPELTSEAFQTAINAAESRPELARRLRDYVEMIATEDGLEHIKSYATLRERYYTAIADKNAAELAQILQSKDARESVLPIKRNLFNGHNLALIADILLEEAGSDINAQAKALKALSGYEDSDNVYSTIIKTAASDADQYRITQFVALIQDGETEQLKAYAAIDQDINNALNAHDASAMRDLISSEALSNGTLSSERINTLINQPLGNDTNIASIVLSYKAADPEELAKNLQAISKFISNEQRLEILQKQDSNTGLDVFSTLMADKDIYDQAQTIVTFNLLMGEDHEGRNTVQQNYVNRLRQDNEDNGLDANSDEIKQIVNLVNIVATTLSDDEKSDEDKTRQIAKITGLIDAIKQADGENNPDLVIDFLQSDTYQTKIEEYAQFSTPTLLMLYPSPTHNAINMMFDATNNEPAKELAFFARLETLFADEPYMSAHIHEDLIQKSSDNESLSARINSYVSAAQNGKIGTTISLQTLNEQFSATADKPSLKKLKAIIDSAEFQGLDDNERLAFLSRKDPQIEGSLSIAEQALLLGSKTSSKLADTLQYIGSQLENRENKASLLNQISQSIASENIHAQFLEYANLYISDEIEALNGLAKVQTTIAAAAESQDIASLESLIQDQVLKDLGTSRRTQILTQPIIGDKTLLTLLTENAHGDLDQELQIFANTANAIDDPELFEQIVNATIEATADDAMRARYKSYAKMLDEGSIEDAQNKLEAVKTVNSALSNPKSLTVAKLLSSDGFKGISQNAALTMLLEQPQNDHSLFSAAFANEKTMSDKAAAIQVIASFFEDIDDASRLLKSYNEAENIEEDSTADMRLYYLQNMAYNEDIESETITAYARVMTDLDAAKAKSSQIAMSNILSSSAFKALPSEYQERFTEGSTQDNVFYSMLDMAQGNPVQEAEVVADIIGATSNQSNAFKQISSLIKYTQDSDQQARLEQYRTSLFSQSIEMEDGTSIDPTQISTVKRTGGYYSYRLTGKDGTAREFDSTATFKALKKHELMFNINGDTLYAKSDIGYICHNQSQDTLDVFHIHHSDKNLVFTANKQSLSDSLDEIDSLAANADFVRLPAAKGQALSAINIARIEAVTYNADKNLFTLEAIGGSTPFKKVDWDEVKPILKKLAKHQDFLSDGSKRCFIRKDTINTLTAKGHDLLIEGKNKSFKVTGISEDSCIELMNAARRSDLFIEEDKGSYIALDHIAMVSYEPGDDLVELAISKDKKYPVSTNGDRESQSMLEDLVASNQWIWRDSTAVSNISRVESAHFDTDLNAYTLKLVNGQEVPLFDVSQDNLQAFKSALRANQNITEDSATDFTVITQDAPSLKIKKASLSAQFNATAIVEQLVQQTSKKDVQTAIDAAAKWLDTSHAKETENEEDKKMQVLGALLVNAYTLHTAAPTDLYAANDTKPKAAKKPRVKAAASQDVFSELSAAFNNASNGTASEHAEVIQLDTSDKIGANNPIMQSYQEALNAYKVK
tara:strand:+ start:268 stop:6879 length:6612 start_codon:yes stop_codon:yes gene_type:complete